jgi:NAD(P)-dependent dehydrogenase (short-subunit alcohol dehydrogenase family)
MAGQLMGKIGLVTGAASGIGRATALAFAREGAKVVVADSVIEGGEETVRMIQEAGGEAIFVKTDVTIEADTEALVKNTVQRYGRLDCAVNNAGITGERCLTADCSKQNWDRVIAINLTGVFMGMKYQIRQMLKQGGGAIVNTSSILGIVAHSGNPAYTTSKHGIIGLTKATALEYVKSNIRVNAVCPGNTRTPIMEYVMRDLPETFQELIAAMPIGRLAEPDEIASAIVWLCSDAASYCTGHALVVDGCYTIQ